MTKLSVSGASVIERRLSALRARLKAKLTRALRSTFKGKLVAAKRGRPGLMGLAYPLPGFRLQQATRQDKRFFETARFAAEQDLIRAESLITATLRKKLVKQARRVARRLLTAIEIGEPHVSLASSMFLRELRIRVVGAIWQLHTELKHTRRAVFTLIPRGFSLTPEELIRFDLLKAMDAIRGDLKRSGAGKAGVCLILFLHGEWDANTGRYQLHFHGWAAGEMVEVVSRLRKQRKYKGGTEARANDVDGVTNRVVVSRKEIKNPAYRLSYLLQNFWPARRTGDLAELDTGRSGRYRQRAKRRIPEPQHAQHLLWLNKWTIDEISIRIGMTVKNGRLQMSSKYSSINGAV